mgnify:CR=1 FL=1
MAKLVKLDITNRYGEFTLSPGLNGGTLEDEIAKLPTTSRNGTNELSTVQPLNSGCAYLTDGTMDIYVLDEATDSWILS